MSSTRPPEGNQRDHRARKRFGQNFLHDTGVIDRIIASIAPAETDTLVEIGPGLGALTEPLIRACGKLIAIELDRDLVQRLQSRFSPDQLNLFSADALQFDFSTLAGSAENTDRLRIVGNLPYNITSPLLFHLLNYRNRIFDMHFMLQKEVVDRIVATPGSRSFGRLSVMMQHYCETESLIDVPPSAFTPSPKVQSAVVKLKPRAPEQTDNVSFKWLEKATRQAFSTRRKTLRNNFRTLLPLDALIAAGFDPGTRAETLQIKDFVTLATLLAGQSE